MIYIQISEKQDARGFVILAKSKFPVVCLAGNTYGVRDEQLKLLKPKRISFKKLQPNDRATKRFFKDFKERLKKSLRQIDIIQVI